VQVNTTIKTEANEKSDAKQQSVVKPSQEGVTVNPSTQVSTSGYVQPNGHIPFKTF
jgi:hypothetical protein